MEACQESDLVSINVEYGEIMSGIPHPGLTSLTRNVDVTSGSTNGTVISVIATNQSTVEDLKSRKGDVLVKCVGEEDSVAPSTKMGSELVNLHLDSKLPAIVSNQISESPRANGSRLMRFTFQRKRKKGSLNENNDNSSLGKKEVEERKSNAQDSVESTLIH
uniref:Uncharacterized protein n=1 Tax=Noccaea caerulescens TaxID=107243 RepID=A0A1J3I0J9_NOCCA